MDVQQVLASNHPEAMLERAMPFLELMMEYHCALMEMETKLKILNAEFSLRHNRNPFESIKTRVKNPRSILEKLQRRNLPITIESMEENIFDIAGVRVICSFPDDIYAIAKLLTGQDDVVLVQEKDYIKNPKSNGYRSLHLILEVPIFLKDAKVMKKVEVQFRTIAMDFWASVEHKLKYKKDIDDAPQIIEELRQCADVISGMDFRMQEIRDRIGTDKKE